MVFLAELVGLNNMLKRQFESNISALIGFDCVDECPGVWNNYDVDKQRLREMSDVSALSSHI